MAKDSTSSSTTNFGSPGMKDTFNTMGRMAGRNLDRDVGSDFYKGRGVANFDPMQTQAFQNIGGMAGQADKLAGTGMNTLTGIMNRDPGSNPWVDSMADQARGNAQNAMGAQLAGSGRFGSMLGTAATGKSMMDAENALRYQAYQGDTQNSMAAAGMVPQMQQAGFAGSNALMGAGAMQQQQDQKDLDWRMQQFQAKENAPWGPIGTAAAMFRGMPFGTTNTMPGPSPFTTALGAGMGAAGIGGSMFGTGGMFASGSPMSGWF